VVRFVASGASVVRIDEEQEQPNQISKTNNHWNERDSIFMGKGWGLLYLVIFLGVVKFLGSSRGFYVRL
jgi:hypothetical protein